MNKRIGGLEDWNLSEERLTHLTNRACVRIHLAYPDYKTFLAYPPAARRREIARTFREAFSALKLLLKGIPFERIGSSVRPRGVKVELPLHRVGELIREDFIGHISIEAIDGLEKKAAREPEGSFWSIKARFATQIEDQESGLQPYEDRILLIKAVDEQDAQKKLLKSFESYEEPYLNASGRLVRWKFEKFLDAYDTSVSSIEAFSSEQGVEVFSELANRKLKPEDVWKLNP
ncbi:DUF4288 domain-containing protein [Rhodocytophaga aerolata]|uniref:DUF4288 domain-containing protein n=1 Tax=Rhodocytophaga aerolata TaxID=455078 RepID=A0ABT8RLE3_9BACT|nr:DUF4288 domain-containing protein [Rhodocytophaga aerolata]MDO1451917.1 DUF4288 domain-containing protein [Rhodocytophaga aerolata]